MKYRTFGVGLKVPDASSRQPITAWKCPECGKVAAEHERDDLRALLQEKIDAEQKLDEDDLLNLVYRYLAVGFFVDLFVFTGALWIANRPRRQYERSGNG